MRVFLLSSLLIICCTGYIYLLLARLETLLAKIFFFFVFLGIFFIGGNIIKLNTLSYKTQKTINSIIDECGDSYISVKGDKIYVKVDEEWIVAQDIEITNTFSKNYTIEYNGTEIVLNSPGIKKTIQSLYNAGLTE